MMLRRPLSFDLLVLGALACSCGGDGGASSARLNQAVHVDLDAKPFAHLSEYHLFAWDPESGFVFNERVVPYDLNTPLFSDYALKQRAIYLPEGASVDYQEDRPLDFPVGSVLIKSFYFAEDPRKPDERRKLIETRLLIRHEDGWRPLPYIWDEAQRDAVYSPAGEVRAVALKDFQGESRRAEYLIPQRNQCENCHGVKAHEDDEAELVLLGPKTRNLDRSYDYGGDVGERNQLEHLAELGWLKGLPPQKERTRPTFDFRAIEEDGVDALEGEALNFAARSYLDVNCAACHNPNAIQGVTSQLFLNLESDDLFHLGVCKRPGSAGEGNGGLTFNIVPGDPEQSILYFRTHTEDVGAMMPLIGRSLTHTRGAELLHAWISSMPPNHCN